MSETTKPEAVPQTLTAKDFLADETVTLVAHAVQTPELGAGSQCFVAQLSADERDEMETWWAEKKEDDGSEDNVGFRAWVAAYCLCDANRQRFYKTTGEVRFAAAQIGAKKPASVISRIFNTASRMNGLVKSDIDELEKKLEKAPTGSGSGESPSASASPVAGRGLNKSRRSSTPNS
jgi:hypothetical protein